MSIICMPTCITGKLPVNYLNNCKIDTRQAGISRFFWLVCDPSIVLPNSGGYTNKANWIWLICQGYLAITGDVIGQQDKGSYTKKKISSCGPEVTISGNQPLAWQDYNADETTLLDFSFYDYIVQNRKYLKFGYLGCNDLVYQFDGEWDIEHSFIIPPDGVNELAYHDCSVNMSALRPLVPIKVTGLLAALGNFNQASTCYQ